VDQHSRPTTGSVKKWAQELATDPVKLELMRDVIAQVDEEDLRTIGYPIDTLWQPLEEAAGKRVAPGRQRLDRYRLQRKLILTGRGMAQRSALLRRMLEKGRLALDVLLRE
jgi:hypothetical protein